MNKRLLGLPLGLVAIVAMLAGAFSLSNHSASAVTAGYTAYVDSVSDLTVGNVQITANVPSGGSATVEFEVQNIPAPGLVGYDVAFCWVSPAALTLVTTDLNDASGLGLVSRTVNGVLGCGDIASQNNADIVCAGSGGTGPLNAVLATAKFTNAGPLPQTVTISFSPSFNTTTTGVQLTLCGGGSSDVTNTDSGDLVVTVQPTNTPVPTSTPLPPGPIMQKDTDSSTTAIEDTANLWLCTDNPITPLINECAGNGKGKLYIHEQLLNQTGVALGAFEFQVKYDHKVFDITAQNGGFVNSTGRIAFCAQHDTENYFYFDCATASLPPGLPGAQGDSGPANPPGYQNPDESFNTAFGNPDTATKVCSQDPPNSTDGQTPLLGTPVPTGDPQCSLAILTVKPDSDMYFRIRPTSMNGVARILLDENCEAADILGAPLPGSITGGLTVLCQDANVTVRRLEGDINGDCQVDLQDGQAEGALYGSFFGSLDYDPFYDLEPKSTDFDIDIKDVQFVVGRAGLPGSTCDLPVPPQPPVPGLVVAAP